MQQQAAPANRGDLIQKLLIGGAMFSGTLIAVNLSKYLIEDPGRFYHTNKFQCSTERPAKMEECHPTSDLI